MISIKRQQDRGAHVQVLHDPLKAGNLNPVARPKRVADAQQKAGERVFGDFAKGQTDHDTDQAGTPDYRDGKPRQASDLKHKVKTDQKDRDRKGPRHDLQQKRRRDAVPEHAPGEGGHAARQEPEDQQDDQGHDRDGRKALGLIGQVDNLAPCRCQVPADLRFHLDTVDHGHDILRAQGKLTRPFLALIGLGLTVKEDQPLPHGDGDGVEPPAGVENSLKAQRDLGIPSIRLDRDLFQGIGRWGRHRAWR